MLYINGQIVQDWQLILPGFDNNGTLVPVSAAVPLPVSIGGPVTLAGHVIADQGVPAIASVPWSVELSDGAAFYTGVKTGQLPGALVGGRLDGNTGAWLGSTAPTVGSKTSANSLPVVIASDQGSIPVAASVAAIAASAAAADTVANPTAGFLQGLFSAFNGATWDRVRAGVVGVQTTFTGLLNTLSMGRYNAAPPALADGNVAPLQVNTTGALKTVVTDVETAVLDLTTTCSSAAATTTVSGTITGLSKAMAVSIEATLQGPTGGTLDVYLQHSPNGGTDWYDYAHFAQIPAATVAFTQMWVPGINDRVTTIGKGTAGAPGVVLAANTFVGGHPFDSVRMVMVTGGGVTLGKSQVVKFHVTQPKA